MWFGYVASNFIFCTGSALLSLSDFLCCDNPKLEKKLLWIKIYIFDIHVVLNKTEQWMMLTPCMITKDCFLLMTWWMKFPLARAADIRNTAQTFFALFPTSDVTSHSITWPWISKKNSMSNPDGHTWKHHFFVFYCVQSLYFSTRSFNL